MAGELGFGAKIGYSTTLGGTYTNFARVVDVMGPPLTATRVDRTHHDMTDPYRERAAGLGDAGESDFVLEFSQTELNTIFGLHRLDRYFRVRFPLLSGQTTPAAWRCAGFVGDIGTPIPIDDRMTVTCKIVWSGKPTLDLGS